MLVQNWRHLFRSGDHIDVVLQQSVEVRHVKVVELGLVREDEKGGAGLGEAAREVDPLLPDQVFAVLQVNLLALSLLRPRPAGASAGRSLPGLGHLSVWNDVSQLSGK